MTQTVTPLQTAATERRSRKLANTKLQKLAIYHDGLPLTAIDEILASCGFSELEPAIYCGREGTSTEQVGRNSFLTMTWYKMESGRYEIVTYVS